MSQKISLQHMATIIDIFGVYEIFIRINGREYWYFLSSEYAYRRFNKYLKNGSYGKALGILRKFNHPEIFEMHKEVSCQNIESRLHGVS